jgi:hypothetical protein
MIQVLITNYNGSFYKLSHEQKKKPPELEETTGWGEKGLQLQ